MKIAALIPAYKPDRGLITLVKELSAQNLEWILVVDDGSGLDYKTLFTELEQIRKVIVIVHATNRGKGAALKTGFEYVGTHLPECGGAVTVDADGQHRTEDVLKVGVVLDASNGRSIVLGARAFTGKVPMRSRIGNTLTTLLFKYLFRVTVSDTQTGLRGVPRQAIPMLLAIPYNRYEYETEMLLATNNAGFGIIEVPIQTIYENGNASSHFNPLIDSIKIYFVLLRFTLASLFSALIDFIIFIAVYPLVGNIFLATYVARAVSLFVNYSLVTRKVFYDEGRFHKTFPKYLALVIVSGFVSSLLISILIAQVTVPIILAKIIIESILYGVNFYVQKKFIFTKSGARKEL